MSYLVPYDSTIKDKWIRFLQAMGPMYKKNLSSS